MRAGPPPRAQQIASIVMMVVMLVVILLFRKQCGQGTANLFRVIETGDGGTAAVDAGR